MASNFNIQHDELLSDGTNNVYIVKKDIKYYLNIVYSNNN